MSSKKQRKKLGAERLQRIIDQCKSVEERGLDPFMVNVDDLIAVVHDFFPEWESMDEYSLDSEAVNRMASVIKLQSDWVKHRSTSLYTDPFLIEEKLRKLSRERLASLFLNAWHPIVELEQISPHSLHEAIKYWQGLLPLDQRWTKTEASKTELGSATRSDLIAQRIITEQAFTEELETLWHELKQKAGGNEKIEYWSFVGADSYEETSQRAYMTSFLVTYGYATFEVHKLEEEIYIIPFSTPRSLVGKKQVISIPVSVSHEEWKRWKNNKHA
ncbi:MAG TPA: hypothetical protein VJ249_10835 [Candidatus Bathyarchaeia archaeon]|nr:hypothetical protein [Candidatus Bathyarchaeia archaeon]